MRAHWARTKSIEWLLEKNVFNKNRLSKKLKTVAGVFEILAWKYVVAVGAPAIYGFIYYCLLWKMLLVFCEKDIYKVSAIVLTGQKNLLLTACLYVLKLLLCATITTVACRFLLRKLWNKKDVEELFQNTCKLGAFALGVCSILELLYTAFPEGFADELIIKAADTGATPAKCFDRMYFVMLWAVTMGNCSMTALKEIKNAYAEYKSHEIQIVSGESKLDKLLKRFRKKEEKKNESK